MNNGNWVKRRRRGSRWHVVESTIATRVVTRCGKEMELKSDDAGLDISYEKPEEGTCKGGCS